MNASENTSAETKSAEGDQNISGMDFVVQKRIIKEVMV